MSGRKPGAGEVDVSREDKVFFPEGTVSKGDLIEYYRSTADTLLRHLRHRPLSLQRFPDGISEEGFYQKKVPDHFPDWVGRTRIPLENGGAQNQVVISTAAELVYLANQGTITFHSWLSREDDLRTPDQMVFDLDPPGEDFLPARKAARDLKDILETLKLPPFLMLTGSRGAHVRVPLRRGPDFDSVRRVAAEIADYMAMANPDSFTTEVRKDRRRGRLFLDVARNAYGQTAVAPYSVRPKPGTPVATPLDWDELRKPHITSTAYSIRSIPRRLGQKEDPWRGMLRRRVGIEAARKRLERLKEKEDHG
jgi:bifunctional non-homologous end joining protein LigD